MRKGILLVVVLLVVIGISAWLFSRREKPNALADQPAQKKTLLLPSTELPAAKESSLAVAPEAVRATQASAPTVTSVSSHVVVAPSSVAPAASSPATSRAAAVTPATSETEVAGTVRMILAHAPLRVAEVADPDSASNKAILNTMVQKALAHSKTVTQPTPQ